MSWPTTQIDPSPPNYGFRTSNANVFARAMAEHKLDAPELLNIADAPNRPPCSTPSTKTLTNKRKEPVNDSRYHVRFSLDGVAADCTAGADSPDVLAWCRRKPKNTSLPKSRR